MWFKMMERYAERKDRGNVTILSFFVMIVAVIIAGVFVFALNPNQSSPQGKPAHTPLACSDHIDNDGDGFCDFSWRKAFCSDGSVLGDSDCATKDDNNEGGSCVISCSLNSNCGTDGFVGGLYCGVDGSVYQDYRAFICQNPGTCSASCSSQTNPQLVETCLDGCTGGQCNSLNVTPVKVAFIGDQGVSLNAKAVLQLIENEGADFVLHQGDLGYGDEASVQRVNDWDQQVNDILGANFPYFYSVGNHDVTSWNAYQQKLVERLGRISGEVCTGDIGVRSSCYYKGIFFILSGVGTLGTNHSDYIAQQLDQDNSIWRICTWHKNQQQMQIGGKSDEVGWTPYETCRQKGAIVATAHEHSYERTKTLANLQTQTVDSIWSNPNNVRVSRGSTFVFVSGLGGDSVRNQTRCLPSTYPYGCNGEWASIYSSNQGATHGALFCTFGVDNQPNKASCYFKDIAGNVPDSFNVTSEL